MSELTDWYEGIGSRRWRRLGPVVGIVGTLIVVGLIESAKMTFGIGLPGALLVPLALFATLAGGVWTGAASAFIVIAYGAYHYRAGEDWVNFLLLIGATLATFAMAAWLLRRISRERGRPQLSQEIAQKTARRYRELVDDLDLIFWEGLPDDESGFSFVSPQVVDLLGYPLEQWLEPHGDILGKAVHPEDRERLREVCRRARAFGEDYQIEFRLVASDGRIIWVHNLTRMIATPDGFIAHGVVVDVTDRRKAEEALRASEQRYRIAQNLSLDAFAILEPVRNEAGDVIDVRWEHANAAAAGLWGQHPEHLRGRGWYEIVGESPHNQLLFKQYAEVAQTGRSSDTEVPFHRNGVQGWLRSIAVKVDGRVAVSLSDVSEQRVVEQALRESEQRFRTLADSAPMPIWLGGPDQRCTYVNQAWLDLTGSTLEQELGDGWVSRVHPQDRERTLARMNELQDRRQRFRVEFRVKAADGSYRWLIDQGAPRFLPDGTFAGYVGSCMDITDRKQAEQQLKSRLAQQETIVRLGQAALANAPVSKLMQESVEQVARTLDVDLCKVLRYEKEWDEFVLQAAVGWPRQMIGRARVTAGPSTQAGYTLRASQPVIVRNLHAETRFQGPRMLLDAGVISGISVLIPGEDGRPYGVFGVHTHTLRDFTNDDVNFVQAVAHVLATAIRRTQAEQAIRFSEVRFRSMFDQAAVGIAHADRSGRFTAVNHRFCAMLGYGAQELQEITFRDVTHPEDLPTDEALARRLLNGELDHYTLEKRFVRKDGSILWAELSCSAVRDTGGDLFAVGIVSDISKRKEAERQLKLLNETLEQRVAQRTAEADERADQLAESEKMLREQTELLQSILDSIGEGIIVADTRGRILVWNPTVRRLIGEPSEDVSAAQWARHYGLHKPDGTLFRRGELPLAQAVRGKRIDDFEVLVQKPHHPTRWLSVSVRPLRDPSGAVRGGVAILHDATERRAADQKLRAYQLQLRSLASELTLTEQRERRRLAQTLHDHLQQILVAAQLRVGVVRTRADALPFEAALQQVADLINEAIDASRSLTVELSPPILYDGGLVAAARWLGRQMHAKHDLTVEVVSNIEEDHLPEDVRILLFQAVRELLFNVVKHAQAPSAKVSITMHKSGKLEVCVVDEGKGFEPAEVSDSSRGEGGFGLFSIRERLELIGGSMHIDSHEETGTRVTLTTPPSANRAVAPPSQRAGATTATRQDAAAEGAEASPSGQDIRVLLADDHKVLRDGLASLLREQPGIEVVGEAHDGRMAVEMSQRIHPDVVVMDITMPRLNGIDATRLLSEQMPQIRVIGLSMHDKEGMAAAMREAGAVAYLPKGGPADRLIDAIREAAPVHSTDGSAT